ncbi:DUF1501 domain-containing protein [Mariniblastus sp.]|mgnify:FL=1|jgi:hypothetical protein|nr:DUF1501 domain-containing protein [Mariniblastus sp.]MDA7926177.1 DUF1501 domain-containing protein [Mariniblastus sp.]MDB4468683.1 DUF1501 domain-containing protein [bacterium]
MIIKDPFTRRAFVSGAAKSFLGVGAIPMLSGLGNPALASGQPVNRPGKAKAVIYLYMNGGMSHLDTFDTKPGAETQGPVESIKTSADGVQLSEFFPLLSKQMHNVAVINSMNSTQGAHAQGNYFMHTSYFLRGTVKHPDMGAWASKHLGKINPGLPANVKVGGASNGLGGGFLESEFAALPIGNPESGLQYSSLLDGVTNSRFGRRLRKLKDMNSEFASSYDTKEARAYASMYDEAVTLMKSKDLESFDLKKETDAVRDRYGRDPFGQGCLLARRLVENGVRFVEVNNGGWDTHGDNFGKVAEKGAVLDKALASLLADLESSGLLDSTLVVLATEFGRTPKIFQERDNGRNHYPQAFSCLLAGGGIKGGQKFGKTDEEGREVVDNLVTVPDFNATIATALGIPLEKKTMSPSMRPFTVADKGEPIMGLFS